MIHWEFFLYLNGVYWRFDGRRIRRDLQHVTLKSNYAASSCCDEQGVGTKIAGLGNNFSFARGRSFLQIGYHVVNHAFGIQYGVLGAVKSVY